VRNRGTIGGSIANADPAADYPASVLGLGATIVTNRRKIAGDDFFTGLFETALEAGEIITAVSFPIPVRAGYAKFPNPASRFAIVGVFVAKTGGRAAAIGRGAVRVQARQAEARLTKKPPGGAGRAGGRPHNLNSAIHASAEHRAHVIVDGQQRARGDGVRN
jgi:carbon-monoxide dehydrogenase medium subunit